MANGVRLFRYTVEGSGTFPFDMLRFDCSYPATPTDSSNMDVYAGDSTTDLRQVTLYHQTDEYDNHWQPNEARWDSFLWKVVEYEELS